MTKRIALLFLFLLRFLAIDAQDNYPVMVLPYTTANPKFMSDLVTQEQLKVQVLLKDLTKPSVEVYLHFRLEAAGIGIVIENRPDFIPNRTLTLQPGVNQTLSGSALMEYFNPVNLEQQGLGDAFLYQGGTLPQGLYTLTVEAYEVYRNRQVSNRGQTLINVFKGLPPLLLSPKDRVSENTFQQVWFQWQPRVVSSLISDGLNSLKNKYILKVWEVPSGSNPNDVVLRNLPLQTINVPSENNYVWKSSDGAFEVGKRYAWQIEVADEYKTGYQDIGFGEGVSEVADFVYGSPCVPPTDIKVNYSLTTHTYTLSWEAVDGAVAYQVSYVRADTSGPATNITSPLLYSPSFKIAQEKETIRYSDVQIQTQCINNRMSSPTNPFDLGNRPRALSGGPTTGTVPNTDPTQTNTTQTNVTYEETGEEVNEGVEGGPSEEDARLARVLDPFSNPVYVDGDGNPKTPKTIEELLADLNTLPPPDCAGSEVTDANCTEEQAPQSYSGVEFTPAAGDLLLMNGYRVIVLEGGPNGKGLINWNFLGGVKMAVNFVNIQAYEAPNKKGGCVYEGEMVVEGSNNSVLDADVQARLNTLMAKINDPEAYSGNFADAVALMKQIATKIKNGETIDPTELKQFKTVCKAVKQGTKQWKDDLETTFGSPSNLPEVNAILAGIDNLSAKLQAILDCGSSGFVEWEERQFRHGPFIADIYTSDPCKTTNEEAVAIANTLDENVNIVSEIVKNRDENTLLTISTVSPDGLVLTLSNGQKFTFKSPITRSTTDPNLFTYSVNGSQKTFSILTNVGSGRFSAFYEIDTDQHPKTCNGTGTSEIIGTIRYKWGENYVFSPKCKEYILDPSLYELDRSGNKFYKFINEANPALVVANKELINQIDELVEEMMNDGTFDSFIKNAITAKGTHELTKENLETIKMLLESYRSAQMAAFKKVEPSLFDQIWEFFKTCTNLVPSDNINCSLASNTLVPRCLWDNTISTYSPAPFNPAFIAGFIDGAYEFLNGVLSIFKLINYVDCFIGPAALFDPSCATKREEAKSFFENAGEAMQQSGGFVNYLKTIGGAVGGVMGEQLSAFLAQNLCVGNFSVNCCSYQHGKTLLDVASLLIGAGEGKLALSAVTKLGDIATKTGQGLKIMANAMSKISLKAAGSEILQMIPRTISANGARTLALAVMFSGNVVKAELPIVAKEIAKETISWVIGHSGQATQVTRSALKTVADDVIATGAKSSLSNAAIETAVNGATKVIANGAKEVNLFQKGNIFVLSSTIVNQAGNLVESILSVIDMDKNTTQIPDDTEDDDQTEGDKPCVVCTNSIRNLKQKDDLCKELTKINTYNTDAATKLCNSNHNNAALLLICRKILAMQTNEITAFLGDIAPSTCSNAHLCGNVNNIDVKTINSWKVLYDANNACTDCDAKRQTDWATLTKVKLVLNETDLLNTLQTAGGGNSGAAALSDIIAKNKYAGCTTCLTTQSPNLEFLPDYLSSIENFVTYYGSLTGASKVLGSQGIRNGGYKQVEATAFILKVLNSNEYIASVGNSNITSFEYKYDDVATSQCTADIVTANELVECKSWNLYNTNTWGGMPSNQFLTYLSNISSMSGLQYWFDADKADIASLKTKFQTIFQKTDANGDNIVFEKIWGNDPLRRDIWKNDTIPFPTNPNNTTDKANYKNKFVILTNNTNNLIYNFIKVK